MENQEQLELIKSMSERLERIEKRQKLARTRSLIVWCLAAVLIIAAVIIAGPKVAAVVRSYNDAVAQIEKVSNALDGEELDAVKDALEYIETVDFKTLKEKAGQIEKLTAQLSKLDVAELNTVIGKLNTALEPILEFFK